MNKEGAVGWSATGLENRGVVMSHRGSTPPLSAKRI